MIFVLRADPPLFRAAPVATRAAGRVYPLVRLFESGLDQRRWNAFVRFQNRAGGVGGIMMIEDSRGAAHAVFAWRVRPNLQGERVLAVSDIVMGNLPGRALSDAIIEAVETLGRQHECRAIELDMGEPGGGPRRDLLVAHGFKLVGGARFQARVGSD